MEPAAGAEGDASMGESSARVAPLTHSILSQAVLDAIGHTDAKLAFDMMLVNEHLTAQDAANRSLKEEVAFLKTSLAKRTHEQSDMFHYFHDKTDEHLARIAALEKALSEAQEEKDQLLVSSYETLDKEKRERAAEMESAKEQVGALNEELRQVHAFSEAKREMEAHTRALETKLDAQRAAFHTQVQDLERSNLLEQARTKQELLGRMQAAKAELMLRTNDQVASATHRTLLENEHFTQELAFQSREAERLVERLEEAQHQVAKLRAQNKLLEANELLMAKKNRYLQKILSKLQQPKTSEPDSPVQLQAENNSEDSRRKGPQDAHAAGRVDEEKETRCDVEGQLQRALDWLRVFQRERQFILAQQDEVIQFLYRSLDEAQRQRRNGGRSDAALDKGTPDTGASADANMRVEALLQLAPRTTTMQAFGRQVLASRPALDELSSTDAYEVLLFLLEKLRLYQVRIAAVYPNDGSVSSPVKQMLERQLGVELPLLASSSSSSPSPSSLKQKRRVFAHVAAAVEAGNVEWLGSPKAKAAVHPNPPLSPQLLAMATNQFNFVGQPAKQSSPIRRRYQQLHHSSFGKPAVTSPSRKAQAQIQPLIPWSKDEGLTPWANTASTASLPLWDPENDSVTQ